MLDPLINPPPDVKARMCAEYVKQKLKRHLGAVVTYEQEKLRQISASFIRGNKARKYICVQSNGETRHM